MVTTNESSSSPVRASSSSSGLVTASVSSADDDETCAMSSAAIAAVTPARDDRNVTRAARSPHTFSDSNCGSSPATSGEPSSPVRESSASTDRASVSVSTVDDDESWATTATTMAAVARGNLHRNTSKAAPVPQTFGDKRSGTSAATSGDPSNPVRESSASTDRATLAVSEPDATSSSTRGRVTTPTTMAAVTPLHEHKNSRAATPPPHTPCAKSVRTRLSRCLGSRAVAKAVRQKDVNAGDKVVTCDWLHSITCCATSSNQ